MVEPKKIIDKDLQSVLREISKPPGGGSSSIPRPLTPGGIQGGPPIVSKPIGAVPLDPTGQAFYKRDIAIEQFRFYKSGETRVSNLPDPPPNTREIIETKIKAPGEKGFKNTVARQKTLKGVSGGVVSGMERPIGSKPPLTVPTVIAKPGGGFISSMGMPMAIEIAAERRARQETLERIQELIRDSFSIERSGKTTTYVNMPDVPKAGIVTRAEQQLIDYAARAARDVLDDMQATVSEYEANRNIAARELTGEFDPRAEGVMRSQTYSLIEEADEEMKKVMKRKGKKIKAARENILDIGKLPIAGKGFGVLGLAGIALDAILMWKELERGTSQLETMN